MLATSQESLGVDGERSYRVRPLDDEDSARLFASRAGPPATGSSSPPTTPRRSPSSAAGSTASRSRSSSRRHAAASMSPAAILERLDERFRLLAQGRRTAQSRHQTLRAAVDWSYELLDEIEQLVFARLSVFAGAFSLEAAEFVVADEHVDALDVLDVLGGLVAKSMVTLDDTGDRRPLPAHRDDARLRAPAAGRARRAASSRGDPRGVLLATRRRGRTPSRRSQRPAVARPIGIGVRGPARRPDVPARSARPGSGSCNLVYALTQFWMQQGLHWEGVEWILQVVDLPTDKTPREQAARSWALRGWLPRAASTRAAPRWSSAASRSRPPPVSRRRRTR